MVEGIPQFQAMMRGRLAAGITAARQAAEDGGDEMVQAARFLVPVDQGDLARSIRSEPVTSVATSKGIRDFVGVLVKAGDERTVVTTKSGGRFQNARIQEFGTKNRLANPFFFPSWRANKRRIRGKITKAFRKAYISG